MTAGTPSHTQANFFCISFYDGTDDVLKYTGGNHRVYVKGEENQTAFSDFDPKKKEYIPNIGYNIYAYLKFIVDHYDALPDVVVFCKNNIYPRHMRESAFARLCSRRVFTPLVDHTYWNRLAFPVSMTCGDDGYLEINDSHYSGGKVGRYFSDFRSFFDFVFDAQMQPDYLKFAPGANYVVPRENILLRSRNFYINLLTLIEYEPLALECYFVERILELMWTSSIPESQNMSAPIDRKVIVDSTLRNKNAKIIEVTKRKVLYLTANAISRLWGKY